MPNYGGGMFGGGVPAGMMAEPPDEAGMLARLGDWWRNESMINRMFVAPAVSAATLPGDVYAGRQATMAFDPQTGEVGTDPRLISILKKYGLPISAAGVAALSQMQPGQARAAQTPLGPPPRSGGGW